MRQVLAAAVDWPLTGSIPVPGRENAIRAEFGPDRQLFSGSRASRAAWKSGPGSKQLAGLCCVRPCGLAFDFVERPRVTRWMAWR